MLWHNSYFFSKIILQVMTERRFKITINIFKATELNTPYVKIRIFNIMRCLNFKKNDVNITDTQNKPQLTSSYLNSEEK